MYSIWHDEMCYVAHKN